MLQRVSTCRQNRPAPNLAESIRSRLVRATMRGRDYAPEAAARAQADYDCWLMNARVPQQLSASDQCKHSLDITLPRLERTVQQAR